MPRCGCCHWNLEDAFFDSGPQGALHRTCHSCLVNYPNGSYPVLHLLRHDSNHIYSRGNKPNEGETKGREVNLKESIEWNLRGKMMKV